MYKRQVTNKTESNAASEAVINELKEQLLKAGKVIEASDARRGELEKELVKLFLKVLMPCVVKALVL